MKKNVPFSRRAFLGLGFALPFLPIEKPLKETSMEAQNKDAEFVTMLTAEGKAVRVRKEAIKNAKVIREKISNQSLLNWLKPKGFSK